MRFLVACSECRRQYDAGRLKVGSRFHCRCGAALTVPEPLARDAAVVRCRSCGATRKQDEASCSYCRSDFTIHDQDLQTVCPACTARVSNRGRYCHACGTPIIPEGTAGEATDRLCPSCEEEHHLNSRGLGQEAISVLECPRCAGLWLAPQGFEVLLERARSMAASERESISAAGQSKKRLEPVRYRKCPVCSQIMNRTHFGRRSGTIVDICRSHGVWFDAHELEQILAWVRRGGEDKARRLAREAEKEATRPSPLLSRHTTPPTAFDPATVEQSPFSMIQSLLAGLFDE